MAMTMKANLINTQVFSDAVTSRLGDAIRLYPLSYVQNFTNQQVGRISVPVYDYIGSASIIGEGVAITPDLLTQSTADLDIRKVAKAVELTDEAMKSGYGNPIQEAENQLVKSIADGIEREMFLNLATATMGYTTPAGAGLTGAGILAGLNLFGEEQEGDKYLVISPEMLADVKTDANYVDGKIFDLNLVVSNRLTGAGVAYILKQGALGLYLAKQTNVEQDRDILRKSTVISSDCHFASHMRDMSKAIRITVTA